MVAGKKPQRMVKEKKVEELREKLHAASSIIFSDYRGLNVAEISNLRRRLRGEGAEYEVVKNTLVRLAVKRERYEEKLLSHLRGPTAVAFSYQDPLAGVRILTNFAREHESLKIKVGIVEGRLIGKERLEELARFLSYEGLLSQVAFMIKSPLQSMVNVLKGNMRSLVLILKSLGAKKEGTMENR